MGRTDGVAPTEGRMAVRNGGREDAGMSHPHRRPRPSRRARVLATLAAALVALGVTPTGAAAADFPDGYEGFHTYAEMSADVAAVAAAHPAIVRRFSIGKSYEGRELWAAKVSDNVGTDENEPEVLYDGLHHGDEHMSLEMTLRILHWLVDGYGVDPRITSIVRSREVWIVFAVNPDGAEHDIAGTEFQRWRKNRQPNEGSSHVGTDLNRNYGYNWGGGGRTSDDPASNTYRGAAPYSAPETTAFRDFVRSRFVDGRQQIRALITFHEYGRQVMWPYGYTTTDLPADMTRDDHAAFRTLGQRFAASNGYTPIQASDLYVSSGTSRDDAYGRYRIFAFTFELSAVDYPDDSLIAAETGRNKEAVLQLAERAWCPYSVLGATVTTARCGAFDDDLEVWRAWRVNPNGTDTAVRGRWQQGDPEGTAHAGPRQLGTVPSGRHAIATGLTAGTAPSVNDVDGGITSVESRSFRLPGTAGQRLTFRWSFAHYASATSADELRVRVVRGDGTSTTVMVVRGSATDRTGSWLTASIPLDAWAGETIRLRFSATDAGADGLVEAAFDDVRVTRPG